MIVLRVGDRVRSLAHAGEWTIVAMIRADANYFRRAVIRPASSDPDAPTLTVAADVLRKVGPMR